LIPRDYITEWRAHAPWVADAQVEQDLVISKALVDVYSQPLLNKSLAFRGATALYKLHIHPPARYSEDIDLVQVSAGPAGPIIDALRAVLNPWLGNPRYKQGEGGATFTYRFSSEGTPPLPLRLKVEINTREHFTVGGFATMPFKVSSRYFTGACDITTYGLNELLGTKLRALYQRRKGRDLFDLAVALEHTGVDPARVIESFQAYMDRAGQKVDRKEFEENLGRKMRNREFLADIGPLLASGYQWDPEAAAVAVSEKIIALLK
jgi:predicted nucleotidyltransferase component of viral defense system